MPKGFSNVMSTAPAALPSSFRLSSLPLLLVLGGPQLDDPHSVEAAPQVSWLELPQLGKGEQRTTGTRAVLATSTFMSPL